MSAKNYTPIDDLVKKYKNDPHFARDSRASRGRAKEAEPFARKKESYEIKEVVEHKVELDDEVKPFVKVRAETVELPEELKNMGLHAATTAEFSDYQNIKLPMSDEKIIAALHQPITSSIRWLATLYEYLLKQAHLVLKVVNGKVVRVIKT